MALYPAIQFVIRVIGPLFELLGGFSGIASIITGAVEGIGAAFAFNWSSWHYYWFGCCSNRYIRCFMELIIGIT